MIASRMPRRIHAWLAAGLFLALLPWGMATAQVQPWSLSSVLTGPVRIVGTSQLIFPDGSIQTTAFTGGGVTLLLQGGSTQTGTVTIATSAHTQVWDFTSAFTTGSQFLLQQSTGNPTGGILFEVKAADTDVTVARFGDGTNGVQVTQAGLLAKVGTGAVRADQVAPAAANTNGVLYLTGATSFTSTAQGLANSVLTANAGAPSFSATPTLTSLTLTANTSQLALGTTNTTTLTMAVLTASRIFTLPNADSNPVQPLTCTGTDKVSAIASTGAITCSADQGGSIAFWINASTTQAGTLTAADTTHTQTYDFTSAFTSGTRFLIQQSTGNPTGGVLLEAKASDPNVIVFKAGDGTNTVQVSQTGLLSRANSGSVRADSLTPASANTNGVLYMTSATAFTSSAQGGTNSVLTASGGAPSFSATPTLTSLILTANTNALQLGTTNTMMITMAALSASRTFTLPNANSNPVQPLTCSGTDKMSAISSAGVITCSADQGAGTFLPLSGGTMTGNILVDTTGRDLGSTTARWDLFANVIDQHTGTRIQAGSTANQAGVLAEWSKGTTGAPDTTAGPLLHLSRVHTLSSANDSAGLTVAVRNVAGAGQAFGIIASGQTYAGGDAYGAGIVAEGVSYVSGQIADGGDFYGVANVPGAIANGIEAHVSNNTGSPCDNFCNGVFISSAGSRSGNGIKIQQDTSKFLVGIRLVAGSWDTTAGGPIVIEDFAGVGNRPLCANTNGTVIIC